MASSSSGAAAPIKVDPLVLSYNEQSSFFPVAANVTTDTVPLCLFLDKQGCRQKEDGEEEAFFIVQVHHEQGDAQKKEPQVWTATIPAGETAGKMVTLAELLRSPETVTTLEVISSLSTQKEDKLAAGATLTIKQVVEKGKKVLLKPTVLRATDAPVGSLAMALSRTATQLAHAHCALLAAERLNSLYQEEHEKMQGLLMMEVANKDRVQEELMFKFNLLLNTKRAKIAELLQRVGEKETEAEMTDEEEGGGQEEEEEGQGGGAGGASGGWKGAKAKLRAQRKLLCDAREEGGNEGEEEENSHKKMQAKRRRLSAAAASGTGRGRSKSNRSSLALPLKKVKVEGRSEEDREGGLGSLLSAVKGTKEVLGGIDALLRETKKSGASSSSSSKKQQQQRQLKEKRKQEKRGLDSSSSDYNGVDDSCSSSGDDGDDLVAYSAKGKSEEGGEGIHSDSSGDDGGGGRGGRPATSGSERDDDFGRKEKGRGGGRGGGGGGGGVAAAMNPVLRRGLMDDSDSD